MEAAIISSTIGTAYSTNNNYSGYDLYAALKGTYHFNQTMDINMTLRGTLSMVKGYPAFFEINPNWHWQINKNHSLSIGLDAIATTGYYNFNFPIYWSYRM